MIQNDLLIYAPEQQNNWKRIFWFIISIFMWVVWLYMWVPLMSEFHIHFSYAPVLEFHWNPEKLYLLKAFYAFLAISILSYFAWSCYNYFRFKNENRRISAFPVTVAELSHHFDVKETVISKMQQEKVLVISYEQCGAIKSVKEKN